MNVGKATGLGGVGVRVDIICAVLDGASYLPELLESLDAQTHSDWRLWVRDDGSADDSVSLVEAWARKDPRITLLHSGGPRGGAGRAFAWLLERVPADAAYVMCADQDDVWLPRKIARTLEVMRAEEQRVPQGTPVLVHTDLVVVDAALQPVHPSFWRFSGMTPEPATLRRLVVRNFTTGAAMMLNRALVDRVGEAPADAVFHDWWYALVAAAFGRVVALGEPTILYRQHGANAVGARDSRIRLAALPAAIRSALAERRLFRRGLQQSAAQAGAFLHRYDRELSAEDRGFLREYSLIPERSFMRRKVDLLRLRVLPEQGVLRMLGVVLRG
jgi:glycosyltransferase involved in cell wall biosynthesis